MKYQQYRGKTVDTLNRSIGGIDGSALFGALAPVLVIFPDKPLIL